MTFYSSDSPYTIRDDLISAHRLAWQEFSKPGSWWTGIERVAIAAEARHARGDAEVPKKYADVLSATAKEAVTRISADLHHLDKAWHEGLLSDDFTDGHYVEIVGICSVLSCIDRFYYVLGLPLEPLPEPVPGDPSGYRPATAIVSEEAWVPMISAPDALQGPEADIFHGAEWAPNIMKAQSLVPDAVRLLVTVHNAHYVEHSAKGLDMGEGG